MVTEKVVTDNTKIASKTVRKFLDLFRRNINANQTRFGRLENECDALVAECKENGTRNNSIYVTTPTSQRINVSIENVRGGRGQKCHEWVV